MAKRRYYGFRKSPDDPRDYKMAVPVRVPLLAEGSIRDLASPNQTQYQTNSCVGNACANAYELLRIKKLGRPLHRDVSRMFIYWNARAAVGEEMTDGGCYIRDAVKGLVRYGVPWESTWPFDPRFVTREPTTDCFREAEKNQLLKYYRISDSDRLYQIKYALGTLQLPVVFGMAIHESFELDSVDKTGVVPMPEGDLLGWHAMMLGAYSDAKKYPDGLFRCSAENSWGGEWGDKGWAHIPQNLIEDPRLAADFWVLQLTEDDGTQVDMPGWQVLLWYWIKRLFYLQKGGGR
jgi:C1A family cysteine protease